MTAGVLWGRGGPWGRHSCARTCVRAGPGTAGSRGVGPGPPAHGPANSGRPRRPPHRGQLSSSAAQQLSSSAAAHSTSGSHADKLSGPTRRRTAASTRRIIGNSMTPDLPGQDGVLTVPPGTGTGTYVGPWAPSVGATAPRGPHTPLGSTTDAPPPDDLTHGLSLTTLRTRHTRLHGVNPAHGAGAGPTPGTEQSGPHAPNRADLTARTERTSSPEQSGLRRGWGQSRTERCAW